MKNNTKDEKVVSPTTTLRTLTAITILALIIGGVIFFIIVDPKVADHTERVAISYQGQPQIGNPHAPIRIMEFGDFKCPACKVFHDTVYPQLKREYIDKGKAQMYFTNFQFNGEDAITAGMVGESIYHQNKGAFWNYYDVIYENQKEENVRWATLDFLCNLIKSIPKIDVNKVRLDVKNKTFEKTVIKDKQLGEKLKIDVVPTIFVNGVRVENGMDFNVVKKVIEEELKRK
jgi:protein-disulfide isomerase